MAPGLSAEMCVVVGVMVFMSTTVCGITRRYYIAAVEDVWDYTPRGGDHSLHGQSSMNQQRHSQLGNFPQSGPGRIGRRYMKAVYREFTDDSFTQMKPQESWMGLLGPIIGGDEGDRVIVDFKNMAMRIGRNFSVYIQGLQSADGKEDVLQGDKQGAAPGQRVTYQWEVTSAVAPATRDDLDCLTRAYQSHVSSTRDVNSGLVGVFLTCKPGAMVSLAKKYARQFAVLVNVFDENESWYIDHNIHTFLNLTSHPAQSLKEDQDFKESNRMRSLNGLMYGNMRGLDACEGERTLWHLLSFSSERDFHSFTIAGHSFLVNQHRVDAIELGPGHDFVTATLDTQSVGQWRLQSNIPGHADEGLTAFLNVSGCGQRNNLRSSGHMDIQRFRRHFFAIKEVDWNYAPSGNNLFDGGPLVRPDSFSEKYFSRGPTRVGGVYRKAVFREYEDVTFSKEKRRGEDDEAGEDHLGFLGPVLRVEVGDMVALTLKNKAAKRAFSFYPQGARPVRMWEGGALDSDRAGETDPSGDLVEPGQVRTTYWFFPDSMGPGPRDPPCISRLYTSSSSDRVRDAYTGLVGPIIICRRGVLNRYGRQHQIDREFFVLFSVMDENLSWYSDDNFGRLQVNRSSEDFYQSNLMHSINGHMYGNLPGLTMCQGDRVSWHVLSVAGSNDVHVHTPYFHGQSVTYLHSRLSALPLLPGEYATLFMKADNPGQWALVDQSSTHYNAGAKALFRVRPCRLRRNFNVKPFSGKNRTYFLQAEEELWDFAPSGMNEITGKNLSDPDGDGVYTGTQYKKVRYHQYTDGNFSREIQRPDNEQYLGLLGPLIMAEAFDVITVVFRNRASRNYSVHAQGLAYLKDSEGSPYAGSAGGVVQPGKTAVYEWSVPLDFAPVEGDPACISRPYYSAVDPVKDSNSGLVGSLVICKPGTLDPKSGDRRDVDRVVVLLFHTFDEGDSWYQLDNLQQQVTPGHPWHHPTLAKNSLMHSINGYVQANGHPLEVDLNCTVAWHLMTLGQQADLQTVTWQGSVDLVYQTDSQHVHSSTTADAVRLLPGESRIMQMNATLPGKWTLRGHVLGHLAGDMQMALFSVVQPPGVMTTANLFGDIDAN